MSGTFTLALEAVLASVRSQLALTPSGWPENARNFIHAGPFAWDSCECGVLVIEWQSAAYTASFPNPTQRLADGCKPYLSLQTLVTALRCVPMPDGNGNPPTSEALQVAAIVTLDDVEAVLRGVSEAVQTLEDNNVILQFAIGTAVPAGPQGGCGGVSLPVFMGFANKWGC